MSQLSGMLSSPGMAALTRINKYPVGNSGCGKRFSEVGRTVRRVICLGSPHGADALAWRLADALEARLAAAAAGGDVPEFVRCASPAQIGGLFAGADAIVILDAVVQLPAGTLRELTAAELEDQRAHSSHGVGLATVLALARALGDLPERVTILGLGVGAPDADPQPLVARFLPELLRRLSLPDG